MDTKDIRRKIMDEYKNSYIFGNPEQHGDWLYYWLLKGNNKQVIRWNAKTDEHEVIMKLYY